ncbi:MAG: DNA repair protein RecO [Betaproteobacteria bacterium]
MRVANEPAFVLHSIPYKETSLILDVFTRDYGRVALIAKGAKRPNSALRPVLQCFQPLLVHWTGRTELMTLTKSEWVGGTVPLVGDALLCGFYMNELIVKFLAKEDAHESLFDYYDETIYQLSLEKGSFEKILRPFEVRLLQESGYCAPLDVCQESHGRVLSDQEYVYQPEKGVRPKQDGDPAHWPILKGQYLQDLANGSFDDPQTLSMSKLLMRFLLSIHLQDQVMTTRQILIDLKKI